MKPSSFGFLFIVGFFACSVVVDLMVYTHLADLKPEEYVSWTAAKYLLPLCVAAVIALVAMWINRKIPAYRELD